MWWAWMHRAWHVDFDIVWCSGLWCEHCFLSVSYFYCVPVAEWIWATCVCLYIMHDRASVFIGDSRARTVVLNLSWIYQCALHRLDIDGSDLMTLLSVMLCSLGSSDMATVSRVTVPFHEALLSAVQCCLSHLIHS